MSGICESSGAAYGYATTIWQMIGKHAEEVYVAEQATPSMYGAAPYGDTRAQLHDVYEKKVFRTDQALLALSS